MAKNLRLSASKITTYRGCPLAYFLKYVKHEVVAEDVRLAFGKVVHSMLDDFYEKNYKSWESFRGAFRFKWFQHCSGERLAGKMKEIFPIKEYQTSQGKTIKLGTHIRFCKPHPLETEEERAKKLIGIFFGYMKIGDGIMERFYKEYIDRPDPIIRETPFDLYIDGHPNSAGVRKKHFVRVIFDRVDEKDGHIVISDYKTDAGDPLTKAFSLHRHPQFTLYSLALRQLIEEGRIVMPHGQTQESVILYHHLRSGKMLETHRSEEDFKYIRHLFDDVTDGIVHDRFTPFYGFHCNMCDYQVPCERWSVAHGGPRIIDPKGNIKQTKTVTWDDDFERYRLSPEIKPSRDLENQLALPFPETASEPIRRHDPSYAQRRLKWPKPKTIAEIIKPSEN